MRFTFSPLCPSRPRRCLPRGRLRRTKPNAGALLLVMAGVLFGGVMGSAPALAASPVVTLLPTSGSASADSRGQLDVALRKAFAADTSILLQTREETGEHISTMADFGAVCAYDDVVCLQKLGILASATRVVVPVASGKRQLEVTLTVVNVERGAIENTARGPLNPRAQADVDALVKRSLHDAGGIDIVDVTVDTGNGSGGSTIDDPVGPPRPLGDTGGPIDETKLSDLQFAGATVGGIGGGLGLVGLLGALTCEAIFWTGTGPADTRKNVVAPLGSAFWVGTAIGAVAGGAGAAMYLAGGPEAPKTIE